MPDHELSRAMMEQLVTSPPWRAYLAVLLAEFEQVEAAYDQTRDNHPTLQGYKQALRSCIERPYAVAEIESPLTRKAVEMLAKRHRGRKKRVEEVEDALYLEVPSRSAGLV